MEKNEQEESNYEEKAMVKIKDIQLIQGEASSLSFSSIGRSFHW